MVECASKNSTLTSAIVLLTSQVRALRLPNVFGPALQVKREKNLLEGSTIRSAAQSCDNHAESTSNLALFTGQAVAGDSLLGECCGGTADYYLTRKNALVVL
jgi:hypothetical protein